MKSVDPNQSAVVRRAMAERLAHRIVIAAVQEGKLRQLERIVALRHRRRLGIVEVTETEVQVQTRAAVGIVVDGLRTKLRRATEVRVAEVVSTYRNRRLVAQTERVLAEIGQTIEPEISESIRDELEQDCQDSYADALGQAEREIRRSQQGLGMLIGCGVAALCIGLGATFPWN